MGKIKKGIIIIVLLLLALVTVVGAVELKATGFESFGKKTIKISDLNFNIEKATKLKPEKESYKTNLGTASILTNGGKIEKMITNGKIKDGSLNVDSKEFKITSKALGNVGALGAFPISGTLNPSEMNLYGPIFLNSGETLTASLSWYPSNQPVLLGFVDWNTGDIIAAWVISGGSATASITPSTAGNYGVFIGNVGTQTITYSGLVSF